MGCDFSGLSTAARATAMNEFGLSRQTYVKPFRESDCLAAGGVWGATVDQNFDNVGSGLLSLFEIATTEGWVRQSFLSVLLLVSLTQCGMPDRVLYVHHRCAYKVKQPNDHRQLVAQLSLSRTQQEPRGANVLTEEKAHALCTFAPSEVCKHSFFGVGPGCCGGVLPSIYPQRKLVE